MMLALKTPRFLQEFMITAGAGGNPMNTVYHYNPSGANGKNGCEEVGDLMQTINDISALLINIIRAGLGFFGLYIAAYGL